MARAVAVGLPHHITQRGNYRQQVFVTDNDYAQYMQWLHQYSQRYGLKIWAYCLMPNHVHFIVVPVEADALSKTFNTLHMRYSQRVNMMKKASGHLWQGRFFSCALDERHLYAGVRYVENNPVRARMVKKADNYKWSSAAAHVRGTPDPVLSGDCYLLKEIGDWSAYLREKDQGSPMEEIRQNTRTGQPCGHEAFVGALEKASGRRLRALPRWQPRIQA
jgi:putative transposase